MKVWIVTAHSESGDDYGLLKIFKNEPTDEQLKALTHYDKIGCDGWSEDQNDGPGDFGSWLHLTIYEDDIE